MGIRMFTIGLENVDTEEYEGFDVTVTLNEELNGKDFRLCREAAAGEAPQGHRQPAPDEKRQAA